MPSTSRREIACQGSGGGQKGKVEGEVSYQPHRVSMGAYFTDTGSACTRKNHRLIEPCVCQNRQNQGFGRHLEVGGPELLGGGARAILLIFLLFDLMFETRGTWPRDLAQTL